MLLPRHQNVGQNWDIKIANRSFGNVSQFKYLGTTVTNQNLIQEEIKRRLNSRLLSKNLKIRIRVFENRVLRRIFGPKRDEVTGEWRKLHNKELHDLYCSPSIIRIIKSRRMRWAGDVARMGEKRNAYRLLVGKPEGKTPGRPRSRWVDNIRMDLGEVGWGDVDWISLVEDRNRWRAVVNSVLNLRVP
jgi:hypothetical protein